MSKKLGGATRLHQLPLGLLPTFGVPLTFAAHAVALSRWSVTRRTRRGR